MAWGIARVALVSALAANLIALGATAHAGDARGGATCFGEAATRTGSPGDDTLVGTPGNDVIVSGDGDDTVFGRGGDDRICGGDGADVLNGGPGNDRIRGGMGVTRGGENLRYFGNLVDGGSGDDILDGGTASLSLQSSGPRPNQVTFGSATGPITMAAGSELVSGLGVGTDRLVGGFLKITATRFDDHIATNASRLVFGDAGDDTMVANGPGYTGLYGGPGNDDLTTRAAIGGYAYGGPGEDQLLGGQAGNTLGGGPGKDRILARGGDDRVSGVSAADVAILGPGADDLFLDASHQPPTVSAGAGIDSLTILPERRSDVVVDFRHGVVGLNGIKARVRGFEDFESFPQRAQLPVSKLLFIGTDRDENVDVGSAVYHRLVVRTIGGADAVFLDVSPSSHAPHVYLGTGNDFANGSDANDFLFGGDGHDRLYGGAGHDTCSGESLHNCEVQIARPVPLGVSLTP